MSDAKKQLFTLRVKVPVTRERNDVPGFYPFEAQILAADEQAARTEIKRIFGSLPYELERADPPIAVEDVPVRLARQLVECGFVRLRASEPAPSIGEGVARTAEALGAGANA